MKGLRLMQPEAADEPEASRSGTNSAADIDDAHHAIEYVGQWIRSADTKAGLLATSVAVIIGAGSSQLATFRSSLQTSGAVVWATSTLIGITIVAIVVAIVSLAVMVTPRTSQSEIPSRFSFPTLASPPWIHPPTARTEASKEAWAQARVLSRIAQDKHRALRVASPATFSALLLYVVSFITALVLH